MSITFIIGNGFDISCGLKSKYSDVYEGYVKSASKNSNIDSFKNTINSGYERWADFEMTMAEKTNIFDSEDDFLECLIDFSKYLNSYLKSEEERCKESILGGNCMEVFSKSIRTFHYGLKTNDKNLLDDIISEALDEVNFISFNYTRILDEIVGKWNSYNKRKIKATVTHVHGNLDQHDLVLGVDNEEQVCEKNFSLSRRGKRGFIKPYFNEQYDKKRVEKAQYYIKNSSIICIYGSSLGDSDLSWKNEIFEWLSKSENNHLIFFDYEYSKKMGLLAQEKLNEEDEAKLKVARLFGLMPIDGDVLLDRIHIPIGFDIFEFRNGEDTIL